MKKISLILLLLNIFILTSCYDYTEINFYYYASSMGIDYKDNEFTVYLYILNNLNVTNVENSSSNEQLAYVASYKADTIGNALHIIYENSDIHIDLHHLRSVILTENFFNKQNLESFYYLIMNDIHFYFNFAVYVTNQDIKKIYEVNNFSETSAYSTLLTNTMNYSDYEIAYFPYLINDFLLKEYTNRYPYLVFYDDVFEKTDEKYTTICFNGYGAINEEYKLYIYNVNDYPGVLYLNNRKNFHISLKTNNRISYNIAKYLFNIKIKDAYCIITIDLYGTSTSNNPDETFLLQEEIKHEILKLYFSAKKDYVDILNINHLAKNKKSSLTYQTANIIFDFNIKIN